MGFPDAWLTCWKEFLFFGKMSIEVWTQIPTCLEVWSFHACQQHSFNAKTIQMSRVWFNICNALMFGHPSIAIIRLLSSSTKNLTRWHLNACNSPEPIHSYRLCILAWTYLSNAEKLMLNCPHSEPPGTYQPISSRDGYQKKKNIIRIKKILLGSKKYYCL